MIIQAIPAKGVTTEQLDKALSDAIDEALSQKIEDQDIQNAKNNLITEFIRSSDSRGNLARFWGTGIIRKMSLDDMTHLTKTIADLSSDDIHTALRTVFRHENRVTGHLLPLIYYAPLRAYSYDKNIQDHFDICFFHQHICICLFFSRI